MNELIHESNSGDLIKSQIIPVNERNVHERSSVLLMPVMDVHTAMARLQEFQVFISTYLQESKDGGTDGGDYGIIPGTKKKTLLKSGSDKLCEVYGLYDEYVLISSVEDWDKGLFDYTLKCLLKSRRDDSIVGTGVGSCSSFESKYRWRESSKKCPQCGSEAIIKGKAEYGGGWLCWGKKGGCGGKFKDGDQSIEGQVTGRVENPDIIDSKNTVLKMAKKRAKIDATIGATRSSGIFTQDMEDLVAVPPAAKEEVKVTEKPITFGAPKDTTGTVVKEGGPTASGGSMSNLAEGHHDPKTAPTFQSLPPLEQLIENVEKSEFIDGGMQTNFAVRFRESLQKEFQKEADKIRHDWLGRHGFTDVDGNPSSKVIPKKDFEGVKADACAWAKKYRG